MTKAKYLQVLQILTNHPVFGPEQDYSISLHPSVLGDFDYYSIELFCNHSWGSFHDGFARFFCEVASIVNCSCSFKSKHGVCICRFH